MFGAFTILYKFLDISFTRNFNFHKNFILNSNCSFLFVAMWAEVLRNTIKSGHYYVLLLSISGYATPRLIPNEHPIVPQSRRRRSLCRLAYSRKVLRLNTTYLPRPLLASALEALIFPIFFQHEVVGSKRRESLGCREP